MSADSENPSALQHKAIDASSRTSDFSLTSVKCNAKTLDGSSNPSVKFMVTPQIKAESSAASFVFAVHANGVSELSLSFDLHCNLITSARDLSRTDENNGKSTKMDTTSCIEESTDVQSTTESKEEDGPSASKPTKNDDSLPSSDEEITNASEASPTSSISTPSDVSAIDFTTKSSPEAGKESRSETLFTKTNMVNSATGLFGRSTSIVPAFGWSSNGLYTKNNEFGPSVTGKGFDKKPDSRACFACRVSAPPVGSPLSWRPWACVHEEKSPFNKRETALGVTDRHFDTSNCPECVVFACTASSPLNGSPQPCIHIGGPYYTERGQRRRDDISFQNICSRSTCDGKRISPEELRAKWYAEAMGSN